MTEIKNVIFDLGGVVFARDPKKCTPEFLEFFSYVMYDPMPKWWSEYDRGAISFDEVKAELAEYRGVSREFCDDYVALSIVKQEEIEATKKLICKLKSKGYRLYVLSNMAHEYIDYIRTFEVYRYFDGEVVSCEEGCVKPEEKIYQTILERYDLDPSQTLFIDDRVANIEAAKEVGISSFLFDHSSPADSCVELEKMLLP
ncbi:MAG: HAD family phosphatase [Rikenellaceae bacterium]